MSSVEKRKIVVEKTVLSQRRRLSYRRGEDCLIAGEKTVFAPGHMMI
jgi:hypothetical protein